MQFLYWILGTSQMFSGENSMTNEEIIAAVKEILVKDFEVEPSLLKPESRLSEDIGLDSLDGVDLVVAIEEKFNYRIQEEDARSMLTLQDIYDNIHRHARTSK